MNTSLTPASLDRFSHDLRSVMRDFVKTYPGESGERQPVHTVYGGAHLFRSDTTVKLGQLATRSFRSYAPDVEIFRDTLGMKLQVRVEGINVMNWVYFTGLNLTPSIGSTSTFGLANAQRNLPRDVQLGARFTF